VKKHKCPKCGSAHRISEEYDARFCERCNEWLEPVCGDASCEVCEDRPTYPKSAYLLPPRTLDDSNCVFFDLGYFEWLINNNSPAVKESLKEGYVNSVFVDGVEHREFILIEHGKIPYSVTNPPFQKFVYIESLKDRFAGHTVQLEWREHNK
jgi:hypothetical protein